MKEHKSASEPVIDPSKVKLESTLDAVEMFSALKKLVGSEVPVLQRDKNIPAGLQSMNQSLQRRFAKGVQYNSESDSFPHQSTRRKTNLALILSHERSGVLECWKGFGADYPY